ncbi:dTDP-4-dehydrorhamnose 3,5-epimerase [Altererythrobacter arenosus]|uniref:dTDP-4-dehydrorhamnose 3,5-epimerase n=1 Tax=Altererythrobacter arenosus TaxID=3032592 RepID=A0ABY8FVI4_9SPHN|nr:dTDP-4-dehydrorhamnose 3,5-epimerase [Altererythrobacter sp. CAU 1644]WFL78742.1 dTDP-4-dehydrorhamnose 3,5-epimerase [Altererythrobacter sp. CAU 1644]
MTSIRRLAIPELMEIVPSKFDDERGFFSEVFNHAELACEGIEIAWVQDNHAYSALPGTVRGLHFQIPPFAQNKLVRVTRGAILDVAVDLRRGSRTYGTSVTLELSAEAWNQLLVPIGFAHGYMTLEPDTEVLYKVSAHWSAEHERTLRWNDPDLAIPWPDPGVEVTLSEKDSDALFLREIDSPFRSDEMAG